MVVGGGGRVVAPPGAADGRAPARRHSCCAVCRRAAARLRLRAAATSTRHSCARLQAPLRSRVGDSRLPRWRSGRGAPPCAGDSPPLRHHAGRTVADLTGDGSNEWRRAFAAMRAGHGRVVAAHTAALALACSSPGRLRGPRSRRGTPGPSPVPRPPSRTRWTGAQTRSSSPLGEPRQATPEASRTTCWTGGATGTSSRRDAVCDLRLLCRSVGRNVLFRACAEEELRDLVTAFDEAQMTDRATRSSASRWGRSTPAPPPAS